MNKTAEQLRLKRIMSWRKFEIVTSYPESSMPQNDMDLTTGESEGYNKQARLVNDIYTFRVREAQIGN